MPGDFFMPDTPRLRAPQVLDAYFGLFKKSLSSSALPEWLVRPEDCGPADPPPADRKPAGAGAAKPQPPPAGSAGRPARPHIGPCRAFDDLDVLPDGSVAFTDASGVHPIRQFTASIVGGDGDGRCARGGGEKQAPRRWLLLPAQMAVPELLSDDNLPACVRLLLYDAKTKAVTTLVKGAPSDSLSSERAGRLFLTRPTPINRCNQRRRRPSVRERRPAGA